MAEQDPRHIAAAISRLRRMEAVLAFDATRPGSRPTPSQDVVLQDLGTIPHRYVRGGNQCKPATSLVEMADGTRRSIADLSIGDMVLCLDFSKQKTVAVPVIALHSNGVRDVYRYWTGPHTYFDSTPNHEMVTYLGARLSKRKAADLKFAVEATTSIIGSRAYADNRIELLGYLLGDGCFTKLGNVGPYRGLQFTNTSQIILDKVHSLLLPGYYMSGAAGNDDYYIRSGEGTKGQNEYVNWIRELGLDGKYAHEKVVPDVVYTSSVEERRGFIAGLIATDGSVDTRKGIISYFSTSRELVLGAKRILSSLGIYSTINSRSRGNPNHRDEYRLKVSKPEHIRRFHTQITVPSKEVVLERLRVPTISHNFGTKKVVRVEYLGEMPVYDITVDHQDHNYLADGHHVCGNSGKSQLGGRETSWILTETHPTWTRPPEWGDEPLLLIVLGRTSKQIEETLWRKIASFLDLSEIHQQRMGGALQAVTHIPTGNKIIFLSHHSVNEAREKVQSFVAHYVWLDELPGSYKLIEEIHRRVQAKGGYFLATFTPKAINQEIRKLVDGTRLPLAKTYTLKALDNPIYDEEAKDQMLASLATYSESYRNTILEGSWLTAEEQVYHFDHETMVRKPPGYDRSWRHVESVDPALKSALGLTIWAEDPVTSFWYLVRSDYLRNILVPTEMVAAVQERTKTVNIIRRISDPHEVWYIQTAASMGVLPRYQGVWNKNSRKGELIKGLQEKLGQRLFIAPWCEDFISEIQDCRWSEQAALKIVNHHSYHLLDSAQYFADNIPAAGAKQVSITPHEHIRQENERRIKMKLERESKPLRISRRRAW